LAEGERGKEERVEATKRASRYGASRYGANRYSARTA